MYRASRWRSSVSKAARTHVWSRCSLIWCCAGPLVDSRRSSHPRLCLEPCHTRLEHKLSQRVCDGQHVRELLEQLGRRELVVGPGGHDHLRLLFDSEVLPRKGWVDVLLVELKDLVVRDGTRVAEVVDTDLLPQGQLDRVRQELIKHRHAVW